MLYYIMLYYVVLSLGKGGDARARAAKEGSTRDHLAGPFSICI